MEPPKSTLTDTLWPSTTLFRALRNLCIASVDCDYVALLERRSHGHQRSVALVHPEGTGARDARLAHAARHDGCVAGHAAARRQDAFGRMHAVDILRRG